MIEDTNRVLDFNRYLRQRFGQRVWRVPLDAGMTCPNRDGTLGFNGCIYCDNRSFYSAHSASPAPVPLDRQLEDGIDRVFQRHGTRQVLAYYQTYTNTYGSIDRLKAVYQPAMDHEAVVGIMIGTRPDCLPAEVIDLLSGMNRLKPVWVELGIQTIHDRSLAILNRGHSWEVSNDAITRLHRAGLPVVAHVILGLPGETESDMIATGAALSELRVHGLKLHHLHAVKGTRLATMFEQGEWQPLDEASYIRIAVRFLAMFEYPVVMMRWVGDCPADLLVAPHWRMSKSEIRAEIEARLDSLQRPA